MKQGRARQGQTTQAGRQAGRGVSKQPGSKSYLHGYHRTMQGMAHALSLSTVLTPRRLHHLSTHLSRALELLQRGW